MFGDSLRSSLNSVASITLDSSALSTVSDDNNNIEESASKTNKTVISTDALSKTRVPPTVDEYPQEIVDILQLYDDFVVGFDVQSWSKDAKEAKVSN